MNGIEIERKFLVKGDFKHLATEKVTILQGYLSTTHGRTVRVRLNGDSAFITIKGATDRNGFSREEYEYRIPKKDAAEILKLCSGTIEKERYFVPEGRHVFEVDVFHGQHENLVIAELELQSEDELFDQPEWLGKEVTGKIQYYNSWLSEH
ncbi:MAG: CYTH domain-containing protein [Dysgonamonadaceae bacterium]|jgi:CYTH domain-containing protein|nr:CYTH domain-containing protein [Dysgonamonadaceae bacterium]